MKLKSLRVVNTIAVRPPKPSRETIAALEITPGAVAFANTSIGTKITASITT